MMTTTGTVVGLLSAFSVDVKKLGDNVDAEAKQHENALKSITNRYQSAVLQAQQTRKTAVEKLQQDYEKCKATVDQNMDTLSTLESFLIRQGFRKNPNLQRTTTERMDVFEAQDIVRKISEKGFWVGVQKALSINGYKFNGAMAHDLYSRIANEIDYQHSMLKRQSDYSISQRNSLDSQLNSKKKQLESVYRSETENEEKRHQARLNILQREKSHLMADRRIDQVNTVIDNAYRACGFYNDDWRRFNNPQAFASEILVGQIGFPTGIKAVSQTQIDILNRVKSYDRASNRFLIPYTESLFAPLLIFAESDNVDVSYQAELFRGIVSRYFQYTPLYSKRVSFIDPINRSNSLGGLSHLRNKENKGICTLYMDTQKINERLKRLTEIVDQISDTLTREGLKSLYEHNNLPGSTKIPYHIVVIHDYPNGFDSQALAWLNVLLIKAKQCGISILISRKRSDKLENRALDVIKGHQNRFAYLSINGNNTVLTRAGANYSFKACNNTIPITFYDEINAKLTYVKPIDTDYEKVLGITNISYRTSAKNGLEIPFAVDNNGKIVNFVLESKNDNFFSFICGSPGSGKSSTLHALIMSAIAHYHPDDLEVWLFDFKDTEFNVYAKYCAPHFRYIAAYNSSEIACDVLNIIDEEFKRRKELIKRSGANDYDNYLAKGYKLPRVMVIIDEFHNIVNFFKEDSSYESMFIGFLKEIRHVGIHLVMSDQQMEFSSRLTDEMDSAVKSRVSMCNSIARVKATLGIQGAVPDQLNDMVNKLSSKSDSAQTINLAMKGKMIYRPVINGVQKFIECSSLYFPKEATRYQLIANVSKKIGAYNRAHDCFVSPSPRVMDYKVIETYERSYPNTRPDIERYYIGTPYGLKSSFYFELQQEAPESNILLVGSDNEKIKSLYLSIVRCAYRNKRKVTLLVHKKSSIFQKNEEFFRKASFVTVVDSVAQACKYIGETANLINRILTDDDFDPQGIPKQLFVFIGLDKMYQMMDASLLTQEQAWATEETAPQQSTKRGDPEKILATNPSVDPNDLAKRQEQRRNARLGTNTQEQESTVDLFKKIDDEIAETRRKLNQKNESVEKIPESYAADAQNQIKVYRAIDDLKRMIHFGFEVNCCSMLIFEQSSSLKCLRSCVDFSRDFAHKIALKMSPDAASDFMSKTMRMRSLNDSNDQYTAIYSLNNGREQSFRPYKLS